MDEYTKSNPGCIHSARTFLSKLTGKDGLIDKRINTLEALRSGKGKKKKLAYPSYLITVHNKDGQFAYMQSGGRFDSIGIKADYFTVKVPRKIEDFGIKIENVGQYKDSLGGGWYQMVPLIKIYDKYFAYMDCACIY